MKDEYLSLIRHALTVVGSILISKGFIDEATLGSTIGAVMTLIGVAAGFVNSRRKSAEIKSLQTTVLSLRK